MSLALIIRDLRAAIDRREAILYFGWDDIRQQYRRTMLGPLWLIFSTCAWIFAMAFVMSALFNQHIADFLPHTAAGLFIWTFFSLAILDGSHVFVAAAPLINATRLPLMFYPLRSLVRYLLLYAHYLAMCLFLMACLGHFPPALSVLSILGILIQIPTVFGIILIMSLLNARYRDVMPIAGVLCQIMPLLTPIAWQREMLKKYDWLADANPFYHLIEIVRAPLLGKLPAMLSYEVSLGVMALSLALGLRLYSRARYRVIFWI